MDFYDILDQVIDLLKQRGRASYRALKRQFALDDAYLEDLKVEIIKVQLLGDGLLVYFGYPQAHEDDAQRAVRTGLGILDAVGDLNTRLQREKGIQLAIHMGIIRGWWLWGRWVEQDVRNSWHWVKCPTLV